MATAESKTAAQTLSTMLNLRDIHRHTWSDLDLREMLGHQLAAPLYLGLGTLSAEVSHQIRQGDIAVSPQITLGQLLSHETPPLELLKLVKRFAKMCRRDPEKPLPSEIVMLLYYASITAAMVRLNEPISDLAPASVGRGLRWLSAQAWLTDEIRPLVHEGLTYLAAQGSEKSEA